MRRMHLISQIVITLIGLACSSKLAVNKVAADSKRNVHLLILPEDTITTKELLFTVKIINESKMDIAILEKFDVTTEEIPRRVWYVDILFKGTTKRKILPLIFNGNFRVPTAKDYIIVEPGESREFMLTINFCELGDKGGVVSKEYNNLDFGVYLIKVTYNDFYRKHEKAYDGGIESNVISVFYKRN